MSTVLSDVIILLSDPSERSVFDRDPAAYLSQFPLTDEEKDALVAKDRSRITLNARAVEGNDPAQQFGRRIAFDMTLHIEPIVELHLHAHDMIANAGPGTLFTDEEGIVYRAVQL